MNSKRAIGIVAIGVLATAPVLANDSYYDINSNPNAEYDYAQVVSVEPLVRQVRVSVPRRECYNETHYVPVNGYGSSYGPGQSTAGKVILGGLIGAAVGHQIGNRQSRKTGAIAGAVIGSAIGHEVAERQGRNADNYGPEELRAVDSERCEVRNEERVEERVDGYRVTYRYNGRMYTTQMPRDPGQRIRVRVSVDPLG